MTALAQLALAGCLTLPAGSGLIRAGDLAAGFPAMAALPPETPVAPAPLPGLIRVFHPGELRRLAARYNLPDALLQKAVPPAGICVTRLVAPLTGERVLEALRREWPEARIELLEFSHEPAPEGDLRFPRTGLHAGGTPSPTGTLWTGWVQYGPTLRFSIWARVKLLINVECVVAVRDLARGQTIRAGDVQVSSHEEMPGASQADVDTPALKDVIGRCARQAIPAGQAVRRSFLEEPKLVLRGDNVKVVVRNGAAQLELDALAEGSGAAGETIFVRNPDSQRRFPARVEARGTVIVDPVGVKP